MKRLITFLICLLPLSLSAGNNIISEGEMTQDFPMLMVLMPGTLDCPGGGYVEDPILGTICHPDANMHIRDTLITMVVDGIPSNMLDGDAYMTLNANWNEIGEGPYYGDYSLILFDYSWSWAGSWTAKREFDGTEWVSEIKVVAYATGIDAPPYQLRMEVIGHSKSWYPMSYELLNYLFGTNYTGPEGFGTYTIKQVD